MAMSKSHMTYMVIFWIILIVVGLAWLIGEPESGGSEAGLHVTSGDNAASSSKHVSAIYNQYSEEFSELIVRGMVMDDFRQRRDPTAMGLCVELKREYKNRLRATQEAFYSELDKLPRKVQFSAAFDPLLKALADLPTCVTCLPGAMADCKKAADAINVASIEGIEPKFE